MYAVTLHKGPAHRFERVNDTWRAIKPDLDPIGQPVREVSLTPRHQPVVELMDDCYRTGEERWLIHEGGLLGILPRWRAGRVVGVAVAYQVPLPRTLALLPGGHRDRRAGSPDAPSLTRAG